jgi:hypothetical protein
MDEFTPTMIETKNMRLNMTDGKLVFQNGTSEMLKYGETEIKRRAYRCRHDIVSAVLPGSVRRIADAAFSECRNLTSITIPSTVTSIAGDAFEYCVSLESVTIPEGVKTVCKGSFECSGIKSVSLPSSITRIGDNAFRYCENLTSVTIPKNVTEIGENSFEFCKSLEKAGASRRVFNETEALAQIEHLALSPKERKLMAECAKKWHAENAGATEKTIAQILNI